MAEDRPGSYTRNKEARARRLRARGIEPGRVPSPGSFRPKCLYCNDQKFTVVQGRGRVPCPRCNGAA